MITEDMDRDRLDPTHESESGTEEKITVDAVFECIPTVTGFVMEKLQFCEPPSAAKNHIKIVIDEIINNIARYAYEEPPGPVTVIVRIEPDVRKAHISFEDNGVPCNPLNAGTPDITLPAKQRKPGGMGILMTKKLMDEVSYEYKDGKNILSVSKNL